MSNPQISFEPFHFADFFDDGVEDLAAAVELKEDADGAPGKGAEAEQEFLVGAHAGGVLHFCRFDGGAFDVVGHRFRRPSTALTKSSSTRGSSSSRMVCAGCQPRRRCRARCLRPMT